MKQTRILLLLLLLGTAVLAACSTEPQTIEVTRLVTSEVPVTVEVTRLGPQPITVEKEIEVTRIVELVVTPTPAAETQPEAEPTAVPTEAAQIEPTAVPPATEEPLTGEYYTVQPGDTLSTIAAKTGVSEEEIMDANNMSNANVLVAGQDIFIPGWSGEIASGGQPAPEQPAAPVGVNLLPNPSFEEGWYFYQGVSEWQLPNGWSLSVDEGANPVGSGGRFYRPEIRLLSRAHLPPNEQNMFVFDGSNTIKAFKGDAPTNFAIYRDVPLQPGTYRLTISFFPDSVSGYAGSEKIYNGDPLSAEVRIIVGDGGTGWAGTNVGNRNVVSYEFTLDSPQTVRLGAGFRNRYAQSNNGWFIDDWSLQALETP
jgi:LysM repeat protein